MNTQGDRNLGIGPEDPGRCVRFGPYQVDFQSQELWKYGTRLKLAGQPFEILQMLIARPGKLVSREELQKRLWPSGTFVDSNHGLNAAVNKLREALCDAAGDPKYIETLARRGYRFIGSLEAPSRQESAPPLALLPVPTLSASTLATTATSTAAAIAAATTVASPADLASACIVVRRHGVAKWAGGLAACVALILIGAATNAFLGGQHADNAASTGTPLRLEWDEGNALEQHRKQEAERLHPNPGLRSSGVHAAPAIFRQAGTLRSSPSLRMVVSGNSGYAAPQFSPDEKRIAFMSNRTGSWQIWVGDADGSKPMQVSFTESAGTPRWSPDGRSLAFDAPSNGATRIFVVRTDGSAFARPLADGLVPSFSRDGKWVYFASERTGEWQVWKVPVRGGTPVQVTSDGGFAALESADGNVYYSKSRYPNPEICRMPVAGGTQSCGFQELRPRTWSSWAVTRAGIVFAEDLPNGQTSLNLYDTKRRQVHDLVALRSATFWVGATADGKRALVNDAAERQISMAENLQ